MCCCCMLSSKRERKREREREREREKEREKWEIRGTGERAREGSKKSFIPGRLTKTPSAPLSLSLSLPPLSKTYLDSGFACP